MSLSASNPPESRQFFAPASNWRPNPWTAATLLVALVVALPILSIPWLALFPRENIWPHLASTVLPGYVLTTLGLMLGVTFGVLTMGVTSAWLVTMCQFPGRRIFEWALLLPMAVPAYVIAYVYTDLLEYAGPVQSVLRQLFGWQNAADYWFPEIRSLAGAVAMMSLVLYPYVYLLSRAAFLEQSVGLLDASRTLGCGPWATFFRVSLPMARPSIATGVALALMETLNDVGTVDFFAVHTLTFGIYDVWLNMGNIGGAAQIEPGDAIQTGARLHRRAFDDVLLDDVAGDGRHDGHVLERFAATQDAVDLRRLDIPEPQALTAGFHEVVGPPGRRAATGFRLARNGGKQLFLRRIQLGAVEGEEHIASLHALTR